jgi:Uma2 family endonuclease
MATIIPVAKSISQIILAPGSCVTIPNVSWLEFESILQELGEQRSARIAYFHNTLEIMVPLPEHEIPSDLLSDIVKTCLKSKGIKFQPFGSTTFKQEGIAGIEPDACFYIKNYQRMIGRRRLQIDDPPPDLAIEIDVTSKTTLDAYKAVGVPEVWVYDSGNLSIFLLFQGDYIKSNTSPILENLQLTEIIPRIIKRAWEVGSYQALEEFETLISK